MQKTEIIIENKIGQIFCDFLYENFREKPSQIKIYRYRNMFTVFAADCFHPGELSFIESGENWRFAHEVKIKEFEAVKFKLKSIIEKKTGFNIRKVYSIIEKNGLRFILIVFKEKLNKGLEFKVSH